MKYSSNYKPVFKPMTQESPERDPAEFYFHKFMKAIGQDPDSSEHLEETPRRVASALRDDFFSGCDENPRKHLQTTFEETESKQHDTGIVIVDNIEVQSMCAHHFLPFSGVAHVGYIPDGEVVGLSKFARLVKGYARRPQVQERLTNQVANAIHEELDPEAVYVTIIADHQCMSCRGVMEPHSHTRTTAIRGDVSSATESKFYQLLGLDT